MIEPHALEISNLQPEEAAYFHPRLWNGETIGHGNIQPAPLFYTSRLLRAAAARGIREHLQQGSDFALETFRPGDTFDAANFSPGTIIDADDSRLITRMSLKPVTIDEFADVPLPPPLSTKSESQIVIGDYIYYMQAISPGIVMRRQLRSPALMQRLPTLVRIADGVLGIMPKVMRRSPVIAVGDVTHYRLLDGREALTRTDEVRVLSNGTPQRRRNRVIIPLGKPATGNAPA